MTIDERIDDWEKIKKEQKKALEATGEERKILQANVDEKLKYFFIKYDGRYKK